ncbi:MAG TPA: sugar ABC transporter substrate-binding protein [Gaiellaceae bacterium]|nr:sugar ABC transporter substrate-binding protein [Gaiellaceae bacterium]
MKRVPILAAAAVAAAVAGTGAAAGGSAGTAGAKAYLDAHRAVPKFAAPGPAFDAEAKAGGKTIFVIPASSQVPFVATISNHITRIARMAGVKVKTWENQGQPSQWVQGMNAAIAQKANAIVLLAGNDPAGLQPQIKAAKAKGIPTIVAHLYDEHQPSAPNVGGLVNIPYNVAGRLIADQAIVDTGGKADALVVTINQVKSTVPMVAGVKSEFAKYCSGCKLTFTDVTIADVATKIQPNVQAALTADPNINYVICLYDSAEAPFASAAIRAAGRVGKVKISTFNGTPEVLKDVEKGDIITMDVGENLEWIGYAIVDQSMRIVGGLRPVKSEHVPVRVFDRSNIAQAGPKFTSGWGTSYVRGYQKLWGLK